MTNVWRVLVVAGVIGVLDGLWLGVVAKRMYFDILGPILRQPFDRVAAGLFYVLYVGGVVVLAVAPADDVAGAALRGLVLGAVAYGTYDLTNRATIQPFPWKLVVVDIAWGSALTTAAATAAKAIAG